MMYRAVLWFVSVFCFCVGVTFAIAGALNNWHPDIGSLFIGIYLATTGVLIYVHKLRSPPTREPRP